jgi:hypothetical protein
MGFNWLFGLNAVIGQNWARCVLIYRVPYRMSDVRSHARNNLFCSFDKQVSVSASTAFNWESYGINNWPYNRDAECLLRGTSWIVKHVMLGVVFDRIMCTELSDSVLCTEETSNCRQHQHSDMQCHLTFYQLMHLMQVACSYATACMGLHWHLQLPTDVAGHTELCNLTQVATLLSNKTLAVKFDVFKM